MYPISKNPITIIAIPRSVPNPKQHRPPPQPGPFLHEGSSANKSKVTSEQQLTLNDLKKVIGSGVSITNTTASGTERNSGFGESARIHRLIQGSSSHSNNNSQQQKIAHRKLQMAKMMSNGSSNALAQAALNNFQTHHRSPSLNDSRNNDPMYVSSRRARSNNFTLKETFDLLKVWASPEMQWQMKHNFRNFRVWEAISYSMSELGHDRTAIQCKNRIQNLTSIFYRIKKSKQDYRTFNFPYYKLIGDVLEGKKSGSSLNSLGLHAASVNAYGQGLNPADFRNSTDSGMSVSPNSQSGSSAAGFAAHLALVEEYQHLINGQPEVYITPTGGRNNSNDNSGLNVLSPEVSLSEGNSPIRVESQGNRPSSSAQNSQGSSGVKGSARNGPSTTNGAKMEQDGMGDEDDIMGNEDDEDPGSDLDGQLGGDDEISDQQESFSAPRGIKRSFPNSFSQFMKHGTNGGLPMKRPRGISAASTLADANGISNDPIAHYLSEMVDIERQWLDMERERAENERHMMMYMMQILQALVSPGQGTDEENENDDDNEEPDPEGLDESEAINDEPSNASQQIADRELKQEEFKGECSSKLTNGGGGGSSND